MKDATNEPMAVEDDLSNVVILEPDGVTSGIVFSNGAKIVFRRNRRNETIRIGVILPKTTSCDGGECWSEQIPAEDLVRSLSAIGAALSS